MEQHKWKSNNMVSCLINQTVQRPDRKLWSMDPKNKFQLASPVPEDYNLGLDEIDHV